MSHVARPPRPPPSSPSCSSPLTFLQDLYHGRLQPQCASELCLPCCRITPVHRRSDHLVRWVRDTSASIFMKSSSDFGHRWLDASHAAPVPSSHYEAQAPGPRPLGRPVGHWTRLRRCYIAMPRPAVGQARQAGLANASRIVHLILTQSPGFKTNPLSFSRFILIQV
jgi:hypothetical protein